MNCFPLYEILFSSCSEKDLLKKEKEEVIKYIEGIDQKGREYIYILIKIYANNNLEKYYKSYMLPYSGFFLGINIQFDLENFPNKLKQMIYKFVKTHKKSMEEVAEISHQAQKLTQTMSDDVYV